MDKRVVLVLIILLIISACDSSLESPIGKAVDPPTADDWEVSYVGPRRTRSTSLNKDYVAPQFRIKYLGEYIKGTEFRDSINCLPTERHPSGYYSSSFNYYDMYPNTDLIKGIGLHSVSVNESLDVMCNITIKLDDIEFSFSENIIAPMYVNNSLCSDTDNGENEFESGTVVRDTYTYHDVCSYLYPKYPTLIEYYCDNNQVKYAGHSCYNGCENGVCLTSCECETEICDGFDNDCDIYVDEECNIPTSDSNANWEINFNSIERKEDSYFQDKDDIHFLINLKYIGQGSVTKVTTLTTSCVPDEHYTKGFETSTGPEHTFNHGDQVTLKSSGSYLIERDKTVATRCQFRVGVGESPHGYGEGFLSFWKNLEVPVIGEPGCEGLCYDEDCGEPSGGFCVDSDGGKNYYEKGYLNDNFPNGGVVHYEETCAGNEVIEDFCMDEPGVHGELKSSEYYVCPNGCSNGACQNETIELEPETSNCRDSEDPQNYYVKGTVYMPTVTYHDECNSDSSGHLLNESYPVTAVVERYCQDDAMAYEFYDCTNGCENGRCITLNCTDTDGGIEAYTKGFVRMPNAVYNDVCALWIREDLLWEHYCENNTFQTEYYNCSSGCADGVCKVKCDGIEMVWVTGRRDPYLYTTDLCDGYRCLNGDEISPACYNYDDCLINCDGQCVMISEAKEQCDEMPVPECTDTDGGKNLYVKGTVTMPTATYTEICNHGEGSNLPLNANYPPTAVWEKWCENDTVVSEYIDCPFGCEDGACLEEEVCTDDDCEEPPPDGGTPGDGEVPPPDTPPEQEDLCPAHLVLICHQASSGELNICVDYNAVLYHLSHDDYLGECVNEKRYKHLLEEIKPNIPVDIPVNLENASIEQITIEVGEEFTKVEIIFRTREVPPQDIPKHERPVSKYIVIEHPEIENDKLEKAKFNFKVEKQWVNKHAKNVSKVVLTKYVDNDWKDLPTKYIREDNDHYYFEAESDGLSVFAITFKEDEPSELVEQETEPEVMLTEENDFVSDNSAFITIAIISIFTVAMFTIVIESQLKKRHGQPENQDHMKKFEIIKYVKKCKEQGFSDDNIRKKLIEEKYESRFIDDCLNTNYKNKE